MRLQEWLDRNDTPNASAFARAIGVAHSTVLRYAAGEFMPRGETIARIEIQTGGLVTATDLLAAFKQNPRNEAA